MSHEHAAEAGDNSTPPVDGGQHHPARTEHSSTAEIDPPARGRGRWVMAAFAALGVALFAVPLLRGPGERGTGDTMSTAVPSVPDGAPACSSAIGPANLDFTLKDIDGRKVRLSDYKGKVILLNFWATWCGPCKLEIPAFVEAYQQYRDRGFVILGVLSEDDPSPEDLRTFMGTFRMNYPVFHENAELGDALGPLWALPTSFVIDRHGSICASHLGAVSKEMLEREIKGLL